MYVDFVEGLEIIGDYAFALCERLQSANIPNSVKTIGVQSFNGCAMLGEVTIGRGVTSYRYLRILQY